MRIQVLKEELSKLSRTEQAELMHFMIELLAVDDFVLSQEWKAELEKREKALDEGTSIGKQLREVLSKYKES